MNRYVHLTIRERWTVKRFWCFVGPLLGIMLSTFGIWNLRRLGEENVTIHIVMLGISIPVLLVDILALCGITFNIRFLSRSVIRYAIAMVCCLVLAVFMVRMFIHYTWFDDFMIEPFILSITLGPMYSCGFVVCLKKFLEEYRRWRQSDPRMGAPYSVVKKNTWYYIGDGHTPYVDDVGNVALFSSTDFANACYRRFFNGQNVRELVVFDMTPSEVDELFRRWYATGIQTVYLVTPFYEKELRLTDVIAMQEDSVADFAAQYYKQAIKSSQREMLVESGFVKGKTLQRLTVAAQKERLCTEEMFKRTPFYTLVHAPSPLNNGEVYYTQSAWDICEKSHMIGIVNGMTRVTLQHIGRIVDKNGDSICFENYKLAWMNQRYHRGACVAVVTGEEILKVQENAHRSTYLLPQAHRINIKGESQ